MRPGKIIVWTGGIAGGKVVSVLSKYAETKNAKLVDYYFKELVGLVGGPAAIALAYYMSEKQGDTAISDFIGLFGATLFIDRLVNFAAGELDITIGSRVSPASVPRAPPPGSYPVRISPYAAQERLPFQTDMTY